MSFERSDQIESYARKKYSSTAANIFVELCKKRNHQAFWTSLANGFGFGSNSPNLSLPAELPELYDNFEIPSEAYGYVSFWLDFDLDFELEERMSLMQFSDFLTDACQIYCELHLKWSQKTEQLAKVYPEPLKGYEHGEAPEFYRSV